MKSIIYTGYIFIFIFICKDFRKQMSKLKIVDFVKSSEGSEDLRSIGVMTRQMERHFINIPRRSHLRNEASLYTF